MTAILEPSATTETTVVSAPPAAAPPRKRGGGPKSAAGKRKSRRNAIKSGLRSRILFPEELAAKIDQRAVEFERDFGPRPGFESFLVRDMAVASVRIERCAAQSIVDLQRVIDRAEVCWDADRRRMAVDLGAKLRLDPPRVAQALRSSREGADWMIARWEYLGATAQSGGGWDDDQRRLAHDLLGAPPELRTGNFWVPAKEDIDGLANLAAREIEGLRASQTEVLDALDEASRAMSMSAMPQTEDAETARLRRYEGRCRRDLTRALERLYRFREGTPPAKGARRPALMPDSARPMTAAAMSFQMRRPDVPIVFCGEPEAMIAAERPAEAVETAPAAPEVVEELPAATAAVEKAAVASGVAVKRAPEASAGPCSPSTNRRERQAREKRLRKAARRAAAKARKR